MIHGGLLVRRVACATALLLLFLLGSPAVRNGASAPLAGAQEKNFTNAYLRPGPDPYYQDGEKGAQGVAPLLGATVQTYYSNVSQAQELANVEDAISKHVDGILIRSKPRSTRARKSPAPRRRRERGSSHERRQPGSKRAELTRT